MARKTPLGRRGSPTSPDARGLGTALVCLLVLACVLTVAVSLVSWQTRQDLRATQAQMQTIEARLAALDAERTTTRDYLGYVYDRLARADSTLGWLRTLTPGANDPPGGPYLSPTRQE